MAFTRDGAPAVNGAGLETLLIAPGGGADTVSVGSLAATGVTGVQADLGADGAQDTSR